MLDPLVGHFKLGFVVQCQAYELSLVFCEGLGLLELVALIRPKADHGGTSSQQLVVEIAHGIEKPLGIAFLVAQAVQGYFLAREFQFVQFVPDFFPVLLQLAIVPGGDAHNNAVIELRCNDGGVANVENIDAGVAEGLLDLLCRHLGIASGAAVEQAYGAGICSREACLVVH